MSADQVIADVNQALVEAWQNSTYIDTPRLMILNGETIGDGRPVSPETQRQIDFLCEKMSLSSLAGHHSLTK